MEVALVEHCSTSKSIRVLQHSSVAKTPRVVTLVLMLLLVSLSHPALADDTIDAIRSELKSESVRDVDECIHNLTPQQVLVLTPELCDLAEGSQALLSWSALRRLSQVKLTGPELQQRVITVYIKQLGHDEHAYRQLAIEGLIKIGEQSVQSLLKELNQSRSVSKSAAAFTLARLKSLPLGIALELSRDSDPRVRYAAIQALDGSVESMAELQRLIADPELAVAIAAADFVSLKIAHPSPELIKALVSGLERDDFKVTATFALARLGSLAQQAIPAVIRANPQESSFLFGSRSPYEQDEALRIVHEFVGKPGTESLDALIELLDSDNLSTIEFATKAISQLGTEARRAAPTIERKLMEFNANPPSEDQLISRVDPRSELINAIWAVTHDVDLLAKYLSLDTDVSWGDNYEDYNLLFLEITKITNGKLLDQHATQIIHRLRRDNRIVDELETRLRDTKSRNRKHLALAFLQLLKNPTQAQKNLIVTFHNEELLSAEDIARRIAMDKSFLISEMKEPIGKCLLDPEHRSCEFLAIAWISLANDRDVAMGTLLANPNVEASTKAKVIGNLRLYNSQSMAFLKQQLSSPDRWQQINAIEAVGLAGEIAKPLSSSLRNILDSKKHEWSDEKRELAWDTKYHDFDFELAIGLALYRIEKDEKIVVHLVEGCRADDRFVLHMLVDLLTSVGGNLASVEVQIFEGLDQAVAESIETLKPESRFIAELGRIALAVNPEAARAKLEELGVHRVYLIRETALALLNKVETASVEVQE